MSKNKVTTIEDYQRYFKGTRDFVNQMEEIQTDIDYEVCLSQTYSKWRKNAQLVLDSNLGEIKVKDFYSTILKNSGMTPFYQLSYVDKMLLQKLNQMNVKQYDVTMVVIPDEDGIEEEMIEIKIHLQFNFIANSFVNEFNYYVEIIVDNAGLFDSINVTNKHSVKCSMTNSFFLEIEKNSEHLLFLINNILPYSYEYFTGEMPALFVDTFAEESETEEDDEEDIEESDEE